MSPAISFSDDSVAPVPHRAGPTLSPGLLDEAYRLAVCLVRNEQRAESLCERAMRGLSVRRAGVSAALVRWSLLRRVLGEGRAEPVFAVPGDALAALGRLAPAEREVLALEIACDLTSSECSALLRVSEGEVIRLRRDGRRALASAARLAR